MNKLIQIRSFQSGNAAVEFVLVASVLIPILLATPRLAKMADVNLATAQAARYGAWEQTLEYKDGTKLGNEINKRFYAKSDLAIRTNQGMVADEDLRNMFWSGAGLDRNLIVKEGDILSVTVREGNLGGAAGTVEKVVATLGDTLGAIVPESRWDIGKGGIYTIKLDLNIGNTKQIAGVEEEKDCRDDDDNTEGCLTQQAAILADTWGASGPDQVIRRVRSLVPAGALQPLGDTVAIAGEVLPMFQELEKLEGIFGEVKPDILPPDRYGAE